SPSRRCPSRAPCCWRRWAPARWGWAAGGTVGGGAGETAPPIASPPGWLKSNRRPGADRPGAPPVEWAERPILLPPDALARLEDADGQPDEVPRGAVRADLLVAADRPAVLDLLRRAEDDRGPDPRRRGRRRLGPRPARPLRREPRAPGQPPRPPGAEP